MTESTLSVSLTELREEVVLHLTGGRDYGKQSTEQKRTIDALIRNGYRMFLNPMKANGEPHEWSFLKPQYTLETEAAYSTGTITVVNGVVTLASGTFPSWAAAGVITFGGLTYTVNTRNSGTQLTLDNTEIDAAAGTTYILDQRDYTLPDDFGGFDGELVYDSSNSPYISVKLVAADQINKLRNAYPMQAAPPQYAAVIPSSPTTFGTTGTRHVLMFYPAPDAEYLFRSRYTVLPNELTETYPYPYGGQSHARTVLNACLAAAEMFSEGSEGIHTKQFRESMQVSIQADAGRFRPEYFGYADERANYGQDRQLRYQTNFQRAEYVP